MKTGSEEKAKSLKKSKKKDKKKHHKSDYEAFMSIYFDPSHY